MRNGETIKNPALVTKSIGRACGRLEERIRAEMATHPEYHGTVSLSVQIVMGTIDRFRVTIDEAVKCDSE